MSTLTPVELARLARRHWSSDSVAAMAVAIALAESGGRTDARGDVGIQTSKWGPSIGLWQIRSLHADKGTGRTRDELANLNPEVNARHAHEISGGGSSWRPWSTFTSGAYKAHQEAAVAAVKAAGGQVAGGIDVPGVGVVPNPVDDLAGITGVIGTVAGALQQLVSWELWRRVLYIAAGLGLFAAGLIMLGVDLTGAVPSIPTPKGAPT